MEDLTGRLNRLKRPRLLVEAARQAQPLYDRRRDLPPLLGDLPRSGAAIVQLLDLESAHDAARRSGSRTYRAAAHVAVLIALIGENARRHAFAPDGIT